jgi:predicted nucleic acid-binding protein
MSPVYVDSSALVKLVVSEAESDALRRYLDTADQPISSILATVEVARAAGRVATGSEADVAAVFDAVAIVSLDARIAARAAALAPASLRSLDSIHLATALELGSELSAFICYDERLAAAARDLGMMVVTPK